MTSGDLVQHGDDVTAVVYVRVPGWLKNRIAKVAESHGLSMNAWAANILLEAVEESRGIPTEPAFVPMPDLMDLIVGDMSGKGALQPCGVYGKCGRESLGTFEVSGIEYCESCRIRVS